MTASLPWRSASSCHRKTASAPATSTAWNASASQFEPGNRTTPTLIAGLSTPDPHRGTSSPDPHRGPSREALERIRLDERVAQELLGQAPGDSPCLVLCRGLDGQLDAAPDAH